jgi:hypothetical protein
VNRTLYCAAGLLFAMLAAAPAWGQVPLIVGSLRDQQGAPIEGAVVSAQTASGGGVSVVTDSAGTFALHAPGITSLRITCRYCEPLSLTPKPGEPVVAIVRRYQALAQDSPSTADLANLPYTHVESAIALRPFTLLSQSSLPYPGSVLSDRGLSATGSLLVDDGVPNYDIVNGQSPYALIPANYEQSAVLRDATTAFSYGGQASGGVVEAQPFVPGSDAQVATIGSDAIVRAQAGSDSAGVVFGSFSNNAESRQRGDAAVSVPLPADQSFDVSLGSEQGRIYQSPASAFAGSFSFGNATFNDPRALNLQISATEDRGDYAMAEGEYPISAAWSDSSFSAGIHTQGSVVGFADLAERSSSGYYDAQALPSGLPRVGATLSQTRVDAGVAAGGRDYDVVAGVGTFWINYAGGTLGVSQPAKTAFVLPSLNVRLFPNGKWGVTLQDSSSFTLPTFVEQYQYSAAQPLPVQYERNALFAGALTYTDNARVRVSFEEASERVNGAWSGTVTSTGLSATWQLAPAIALRAWTMHVTDNVPLYGGGLPYFGAAPTVNALWLTYDAGTGLRADAVYRRDLLNGAPFYHVDGAISGPIVNRLRWYAGAEDWLHRTFVDAGIRF